MEKNHYDNIITNKYIKEKEKIFEFFETFFDKENTKKDDLDIYENISLKGILVIFFFRIK